MQSQRELCIGSTTALHVPGSCVQEAPGSTTEPLDPGDFNISRKSKSGQKNSWTRLSTNQSEEAEGGGSCNQITALPLMPWNGSAKPRGRQQVGHGRDGQGAAREIPRPPGALTQPQPGGHKHTGSSVAGTSGGLQAIGWGWRGWHSLCWGLQCPQPRPRSFPCWGTLGEHWNIMGTMKAGTL